MTTKKYLTFDELLLRWNCEKNDIHHLIESSDLVPSITWDGYGIQCEWKSNPENSNEFILNRLSDGNEGFVKQSFSNRLYLRNPTPSGPNKYYFTNATIESLPKLENFASCSWYHLISDLEHNFKSSIQSDAIETDAVFMIEKIECCESLHPTLLSKNEINITDIDNENYISIKSKNKIAENNNFNQRERNNLHRIIAALVQTLINENSADSSKPHLKNQSALIMYLDEQYDGYEGLSKANLEKVLALGNKAIQP